MKSNHRQLDCGVMFFSASAESTEENKYRVVLETAKHADRHGFSSIWVPERHFTLLGGLYPNPSVLQAALAMVTERIQLRAGSVVLPLHNPLRVAEEWAMVDNLSGGRVGISFASGWHPADFTFFPERYAERQDVLFEAIPTVQKLWRGESLTVKSGSGQDAEIAIFPRPVQKELPTWVTAAGNPQTYARVGALGANLLTHLLDQETEDLARKIALYREARTQNGHDPRSGRVSIMIHTFLGADTETAREKARRPFCEFLKLNAGLLNGLAKARGREMDVSQLSEADREAFVNFIYDRFVGSRAFIGSPASCVDLAAELGAAGVDEILFLLDFGPSYEDILQSLPHLNELKELCSSAAFADRLNQHSAAVELASPAGVQATVDDSLAGIRARCRHTLSGSDFYASLRDRGVLIDPSLQAVEELYVCDGEALGRVVLSAGSAGDGGAQMAAALDACMQVAFRALPEAEWQAQSAAPYLPGAVDDLRFHKSVAGPLWSHARCRSSASQDSSEVAVDLRILDDGGQLVATLKVALQRISRPSTQSAKAGAGEWLYGIEWQASQWQQRDREPAGWLILADESGVGESLAHLLRERGDTCSVLTSTEQLRGAIGTLSQDTKPFRGIVHLRSLDAATPTERLTLESLELDTQRGLGTALEAMQALVGLEGSPSRPKLWLVTRGAQHIDHAEVSETRSSLAVAQAPVWGLGQTFSAEHNQLWGALVDLDPASTAVQAACDVLQTVDGDTAEDLLGFRGGKPYVARLVPRGQELRTTVRFREDASYLVTGGLGGVGRITAEWLVARGAKHVVLLGRSAPPAGDPWVSALEARGANVSVASVDVGDQQAWSDFLASHDRSGRPPIRGVFHAAGTLNPRRLMDLDMADVQKVFRSKVAGTLHLHRAFEQRELDHFVLFSSAPPRLGALGQNLGAYNAANMFMDAMAYYRRSRGLSALTINWGPWSEVGLHTVETTAKSNLERLSAFGLDGISNEKGVEILGHALSHGDTQSWAIHADWTRLFENDFLIAAKPFFSALAANDITAESEQLRRQRDEFLSGLRTLTPKARRQRLEARLREIVIQVMRLDPAQVDWRRGLFDMGMDSLMALELKTKLQNAVGISIPATLAFDYPTVDAIVGYLEGELFSKPGTPQVQVQAVPQVSKPSLAEAELDAFSEAELEAALLDKIASL